LDAHSESPNLDFLRTSAVSFVLLFHVLLYFQHTTVWGLNLHSIGHWGVLIFFVHTSLVLMFSMERQAARVPGEPIFWSFLFRRIVRIYPLSILSVLTVAVLRLPMGHVRQGVFFSVNLHLPGLLSNLFLVQDLTHTESNLAPLWSLPYEMRMYLVLPLLYLIAKQVRSPIPVLILWAGGVLAGLYALHLEPHGFSEWFIYVPCFLSGVVAYKLVSLPHLKLPAWIWPAALGLITWVYVSAPSAQRSWWCCLTLGIVLPQFREISNAAFRKIFQLVARYSYGIYLTHFIFIWLAFDKLSFLPKAMQIAIFVLTVVIVPVALYHLVEEPMIRAGRRFSNQWSTKRKTLSTWSPSRSPSQGTYSG
jgi:peptidoglycan/LPS O-acetylase OafA/YrhL